MMSVVSDIMSGHQRHDERHQRHDERPSASLQMQSPRTCSASETDLEVTCVPSAAHNGFANGSNSSFVRALPVHRAAMSPTAATTASAAAALSAPEAEMAVGGAPS
jgi:hypothetical protein